jgi:hypothetical protein
MACSRAAHTCLQTSDALSRVLLSSWTKISRVTSIGSASKKSARFAFGVSRPFSPNTTASGSDNPDGSTFACDDESVLPMASGSTGGSIGTTSADKHTFSTSTWDRALVEEGESRATTVVRQYDAAPSCGVWPSCDDRADESHEFHLKHD